MDIEKDFPQCPPDVMYRVQGVHQIEDQTVLEVGYKTQLTRDETRDVIAAAEGLEPIDPKSVLGKKAAAVAFSSKRWKSSWDPHAPKPDPNLN